MRLSTRRTATIILLAAFWHSNLLAHDIGLECREIGDATARLKCYDDAIGTKSSAVNGTTGRPGSNATTSNSGAPQAVTASKASPESVFGLSQSQLTKAVESPASLTAKVQKVSAQAYIGRWVVTLDNGQVWEQRETTPAHKRPKEGDTVVIKEASLGSFLMTIPGRGVSRVKRIG
jgi:hypothetical protein